MKIYEIMNEPTKNQPSPEWKAKLANFAQTIVTNANNLVGLELTSTTRKGDEAHVKINKVDFFSDYHIWEEYKGTEKFLDPEKYNRLAFTNNQPNDGSVQKAYAIVLTLSDGTFLSLGGTVDALGNNDFKDNRFTAASYDVYPNFKNYGSGKMVSRKEMKRINRERASLVHIVQKIYDALK